jgi:hypothetical protein
MEALCVELEVMDQALHALLHVGAAGRSDLGREQQEPVI